MTYSYPGFAISKEFTKKETVVFVPLKSTERKI